MRFTDPEYHLPKAAPLSVLEELSSGVNKPLLMRIVEEDTGVLKDCVVKIRASEGMLPDACMKECIAAFMAMEMEFSLGMPILITVDAQFSESQQGMFWYGRLCDSLGANYGSEYLKGQSVTPKSMEISAKQKRMAADIIAFDALIQNSDRTAFKPNLLVDGISMHLIDHEKAFAFLHTLPWEVNTSPWNLTELDKRSIRNHLLYSKVKRTHFDADAFCEKMDRLDEVFWDKAWKELPLSWHNEEQFNRIKDTMLALRANRQTFVNQVSRSLS